MAIGVAFAAVPDGPKETRVELFRLHVPVRRQCWPFLVPGFALVATIQVGDDVRVDFDLAAFALDDDGPVAEQAAGLAVGFLVTGVEDALQDAIRIQGG